MKGQTATESGRYFRRASVFVDNEREIKARVLQRLRTAGDMGARPIVASEYCIGQSGVRADLVIASRTTREVIGIEVKSAADTLRRLPNQISAYTQAFDRVIVVAAHKHQALVRQLPMPGVEIWEIEKSGSLAIVRPGRAEATPKALSRLLTQRELSKYRGLLSNADGGRDAFFAAFEDRHGTSSDDFWTSVGRRVLAENLSILSRFEKSRTELRDADRAFAESMVGWATSAA